MSDNCLYTKGDNLENAILVLIFVDDIIIASKNLNKIIDIKESFKKEFEMQDFGLLKYFWVFILNEIWKKKL